MLPEIAGTEMLVIAAVALIVVGPKDLPLLLRKLGQFVGRLRAMASEFRASFDEMARQSELDELRKEVQAMREGRMMETATGADDVNAVMNDIDAGLKGGSMQLHPAGAYRYEPTAEEIADSVSAVDPEPEPALAPAKPAPRARTTAAKPRAPSAAAKPRGAKATPATAKPTPRKRAVKAEPGAGA